MVTVGFNTNSDSVNSQMPQQTAETRESISTPLQGFIKQGPEGSGVNWNERVVKWIGSWESSLEFINLPNIQNKLDQIGRFIESTFAPLTTFNQWLDSNGTGDWSKQLATFLAKLPARVVRNIVRLLYNMVKGAIYTAVHPVKASLELAKLFVQLVHELTKPETWSKIGAGIIGGTCGQSLITGNPLAPIALGVGAAMILGGVSVGALKAAIYAESGTRCQEALNNAFSQVKDLPEAALTALCMGLIMGKIQQHFRKDEIRLYTVTSPQEATDFANAFIKQHGLPQYTQLYLYDGTITIRWDLGINDAIKLSHPHLFTHANPGWVEMYLGKRQSDLWIAYGKFGEIETQVPLTSVGFNGSFYPLPPENIALSTTGPLVSGATNVGTVYKSE